MTAVPAVLGRTDDDATGTLLRFALWRERFGLPWWLAGVAVLLGYQSWGSQSLYASPMKLAQLRETMSGNAAIVAMSGPPELLSTIGGEVVFEIFAYLSIVVGLMNMFVVVRSTRADEESGRAELLRSASVGRRAPLLAAIGTAWIANGAVAIVVFAAAVLTGLPTAGSVLLAAALAGVGVVFAGITAVAVQIFENPRMIYGAVSLALGVAYALRAIGDVGDGTASWFSPIGWGQRTFPYAADRWWPLLLPAVAGIGLVAAAIAIVDRRDFGAAILGNRRGRATASWALSSSLGLAWRLQRGSLTMWLIGVFALGAAYGSFGDSIQDFLADNPQIAEYLPGGADRAVDAYFAVTVTMAALLATAYGVAAVLRARSEETSGRAEVLFAAPVDRIEWLASHVGVAIVGSALVAAAGGLGNGIAYGATTSDAGQALRLTGTALAYVPACWLLIAVAACAIGFVPRVAVATAWAAFAYCVVVALFTDSFRLPHWVGEASPFAHTPRAPLENITATPILAVVIVTAGILLAGARGYRRRDVGF